ncbi:hypothetical protein ISCGN_002730 [Ixodes scapularis]
MQAAASRDRSTSGAVDDDFDICLAAYKRQRGKAQRGASAQRLLLTHSKEGSNDNSPKSKLSRDGFLPSVEQDLRLNRMYVPPMVKCEVEMTSENHAELFSRDSLVYLSPDAPESLPGTPLDASKVYVIGGLVDETVRKLAPLSLPGRRQHGSRRHNHLYSCEVSVYV